MNLNMCGQQAYELQFQSVMWEEFRTLGNSDFINNLGGLINSINGILTFIHKLSSDFQGCRSRCKQIETKSNAECDNYEKMKKLSEERIKADMTEVYSKGECVVVQAIKRKRTSKLSTPPKKCVQSPRNKHLEKDEPIQFYDDIKTEIVSPEITRNRKTVSMQVMEQNMPSKSYKPATRNCTQPPRNKHLEDDDPTQFGYDEIKTKISSPEVIPNGCSISVQEMKRNTPSKLCTSIAKKNGNHSPRNKHLENDEPTQFCYDDIKTKNKSPIRDNSVLLTTDASCSPSSPILVPKTYYPNKAEDDNFKTPLRKRIKDNGIKSFREQKPLEEINNKPSSKTIPPKCEDEYITSNLTKSKENSTKRHSPECVKTRKAKNNKKLVQSILNIPAYRLKKPLDSSNSGSLCRGQRSDIKQECLIEDSHEKAQMNEAIQRSLTDMKKYCSIEAEDDEIIAASPLTSYEKSPSHQPQKTNLVKEESLNKKLDCMDGQIADFDETIFIDAAHPAVIKKPFGKIFTENDVHNNSISLLPSSKDNKKPFSTVTTNKSNEFIYKEATVRKHDEKKKLQGWLCKECKDYYKAEYYDDPEMLELMLNKCSKHRGRFNPERELTPPRYWDVWFSPTQDD